MTSRRWITTLVASAVAVGSVLVGAGVAEAGPAPGIIDGEPCTAEGELRDERTTQHWEPLNVSAEAFGPATLSINKTESVAHTVSVGGGIDLKVVSASVGFDVTHSEAVSVIGSFTAPPEPRGAKWTLTANVRAQDHLLYTCNGGKYARVGYVAQKLNQTEFLHYMEPATPYIPG